VTFSADAAETGVGKSCAGASAGGFVNWADVLGATGGAGCPGTAGISGCTDGADATAAASGGVTRTRFSADAGGGGCGAGKGSARRTAAGSEADCAEGGIVAVSTTGSDSTANADGGAVGGAGGSTNGGSELRWTVCIGVGVGSGSAAVGGGCNTVCGSDFSAGDDSFARASCSSGADSDGGVDAAGGVCSNAGSSSQTGSGSGTGFARVRLRGVARTGSRPRPIACEGLRACARRDLGRERERGGRQRFTAAWAELTEESCLARLPMVPRRWRAGPQMCVFEAFWRDRRTAL
jgi:hypothetical protein